MPRPLRFILLGLLISAGLLSALVYSLTWRPDAKESLPVACTGKVPSLVPGQALKVMTWNLQYLAGKRYVFWNDQAQGPDERPTLEDMAFSLDEVARVIRDEQPDIVLLQELDNGAKASDYQDQLKLLQERLTDLYPCSTQAFDWKADFVPSPHIFGSVGRQLATLSRYRIEHAERLQLPVPEANLFSRQFQPKNAVLVSYLPLSDGGQMAVLNTHLDRATKPDDTLQAQVNAVTRILDRFEARGTPWLIGGDFNLLPWASTSGSPRATHALLRRQRVAQPLGQVPDDPHQQRSQRHRPRPVADPLPQRSGPERPGSHSRLSVPQPAAQTGRGPGTARRHPAHLRPPAADRPFPAARRAVAASVGCDRPGRHSDNEGAGS
ncbi:endonuclease/exonuclease/phosphatase family protein [Pseudomonas chlororaphis]|uniref:endonuclease/exonuclease/phosphatase family protein n=1 Tax=Pseudomonas chlororaphis TaxID=587753 RepID=UPI003857C0A5